MNSQEILTKTPEEIEKEASQYPVTTFADIIRALKTHPEWLEEIRRIILTAELLELPRKFNELLDRVGRLEGDVKILKKDVETLKQDVEILKQDVAILKQDVEVLKQDVAILKKEVEALKQDVEMLKRDVEMLKQDVAYLKGEFGRFKGREFERTIRERYFAYFGRILRRSKKIEMESILPAIEELLDRGTISDDQYDSLLKLDLIVEGQIRTTQKPVVLAVEISYSVYEDDINKALERANLLSALFEKEVIPTVVGVEVKEEIVSFAEERGILVVRTDY